MITSKSHSVFFIKSVVFIFILHYGTVMFALEAPDKTQMSFFVFLIGTMSFRV